MQPCNDKTKLYIISPPQIELDNFLPRLEVALQKHKPALFQLRLKEVSDSQIIACAYKIRQVCKAHNVKFILNDSAELAYKCGADGVHLGEESENYEQARKILGDKAHIGISCYADVARALEFAQKGADLVSFGQFHPTKTKPPKGWATTETITNFLETRNPKLLTRVAAIGGLNFENCTEIENAGADYICMVSAIWS
jgi:thiamine-phosphate pyrophosphorylase